MEVIIGVILALVLIDSVNRWRHPEDYRVQEHRRDWRASGRDR